MQIFPRSLNFLPLVLAVATLGAVSSVVFGVWYWGSPRFTQVGYAPRQPVPYSHRLHAGEMGMDCRYCHANVERSAEAMIPPTQTCMNCHSLVRTDSARLAPVINSWNRELRSQGASAAVAPVTDATEAHPAERPMPIEWVRVHRLPDHAYFPHSPHLAAGVGCASCHGRIDQMEVVRQDQPLSMGWCLDCHRNPAPHLRPTTGPNAVEVTKMDWTPGTDAEQQALAAGLAARGLVPPQNCSGCHR